MTNTVPRRAMPNIIDGKSDFAAPPTANPKPAMATMVRITILIINTPTPSQNPMISDTIPIDYLSLWYFTGHPPVILWLSTITGVNLTMEEYVGKWLT
jgi:hypothetical protein